MSMKVRGEPPLDKLLSLSDCRALWLRDPVWLAMGNKLCAGCIWACILLPLRQTMHLDAADGEVNTNQADVDGILQRLVGRVKLLVDAAPPNTLLLMTTCQGNTAECRWLQVGLTNS